MPTQLFFNIFSCSCGEIFKSENQLKDHLRKWENHSGHLKIPSKHITFDTLQADGPKISLLPGRKAVGYI